MVLSTEWSQVVVIDLVNDGSGFGFGIVGGKSTGVIVKSILPGGIADRDGRLQSGDHMLQINEVNLTGFTSAQVATVLRQSGTEVRIIVARPIEMLSPALKALCSVVPTKTLIDPEGLNNHLIQNGYITQYQSDSVEVESEQTTTEVEINHYVLTNGDEVIEENCVEVHYHEECQVTCEITLPETKRFQVELEKNEFGLGITIAGYVCEREDLCGIFVKDISKGSAADKCGMIAINDRIIEVDGQSLEGFTNHEAVDKLKNTGTKVLLSLERFLRGPKYEHLQEALAVQQEKKDLSPTSPSITTLSWIPVETEIEAEGESVTTVNSEVLEQNPDSVEIFIDADYEGEVTDDLERAIKKKWQKAVGCESEIIVTHLKKLKGLGISLEGTVDVENGVELRPHHYIRSILPDGPVGLDGKLASGDELLEVNGQKLLGLKHVDVVKILKELPGNVRIVCARNPAVAESRVINPRRGREAFATRSLLGGSLHNLLDRLSPDQAQPIPKAISDSSLNTSSSTSATMTTEPQPEPVPVQEAQTSAPSTPEVVTTTDGLALWSDEPEEIELIKSDWGLGFSILDYQDPVDVKGTSIVVRSLVPHGPAEADGRLQPGDRLVSVNGRSLRGATLDVAVRALKATIRGPVRLGVCKPLLQSGQRKKTSVVVTVAPTLTTPVVDSVGSS